MNNQQKLDYEFDSFTNYLIPFGSLDIRTAVNVALEVGEDGEWAAQICEQEAEEFGVQLKDIDPVGAIYDAILQDARSEIEEETGFDFVNDGAEIWVSANYMATSYDFRDDANVVIKERLQNAVPFDELSEKTKWFLSEIEANY